MRVLVDQIVANAADRAVPAAVPAFIALPDGFDVELDLHPQIGAAFLDRVAQPLESEVAILLRVAGDDETTAPPNEFEDAEVFEMTAIGEINVVPLGIR